MSLKTRLLLIISGVILLNLIGETLFQVRNWKDAIRSEVDSSFNLAKRLVESELLYRQPGATSDVTNTVVEALQQLRHIRIYVGNDADIVSLIDDRNFLKDAGVPAWFIEFIWPYNKALPILVIPDLESSRHLLIKADPGDEIMEVWEDFRTQIFSMFLFLLVVVSLIYICLHIELRPLNNLLRGFQRLEEGSFDISLEGDTVTELSRINQKFNHLVSVLRSTAEENSMLTRKLVNLQEEERRTLAHELHDEMAPHLFGIRVANIRVLGQLHEKDIDGAMKELNSIDCEIGNLQEQTRRMLTRLRPQVLDDLNLEEALHSLVNSGSIRKQGINWDLQLKDLDKIHDDTIKVTLYRIVQECVTNIVRHARASNVKINVSADGSVANTGYKESHVCDKVLTIVVKDDGRGIPDKTSRGFGLIGIRERVQALGGKYTLESKVDEGVEITITIPMNEIISEPPAIK